VKTSAGILMHRRRSGRTEVLLVHPGGPFWARKDAGAWSIPKGEYLPGEDALAAAAREFAEELGVLLPAGAVPVPLGDVRQRGGKVVAAWAVEGDVDCARIRSNTFALQWPPGSGRLQDFPEVDRAEWFSADAAAEKINPAQRAFLDRLIEHLEGA